MKMLPKVFAILSLALALGACAAKTAEGPQGPVPRETRVQVVNHGWSEMVIYADRSGARFRLGSVTSLSRAVMDIPAAVLRGGSSFRFLVSPIGSSVVHTTETVHVSPGEMVAFEIRDNLALSSVTVWAQ